MNLPNMVNIYNLFCKREIFTQPPGESCENHLGEVRATQNFIKDKMTGAFLRKTCSAPF